MSGLIRYAVILLSLCLAGCLVKQARTEISRQIQVFGIELDSSVDYREISGVRAVEEPCLKGYERSFDALDITIGYGFDKKIRRISTLNPGTSVFGISPGMSVDAGRRLAQQSGLTELSPTNYRGNGIILTLLVDGNGKMFGITIEAID